LKPRSKSIAPQLVEAAEIRGLFTRVARRLGVTRQHVRQVAYGTGTSRRVSLAIKRELRQIRGRNREIAA
jgi:hypothetical protein